MTTTIKLPRTSRKVPSYEKKGNKKVKRKSIVFTVIFFTLAVAVLSVSLPHLAQGMHDTLGLGWFASVALAVLFDLSQVAAEGFILALAKDRGEKNAAYSVIIGCTLVSIAYNGMAFLQHASGFFGIGSALALTVLLPLGVLTLSFLGQRSLMKSR